jgi:hypothetical protein
MMKSFAKSRRESKGKSKNKSYPFRYGSNSLNAADELARINS